MTSEIGSSPLWSKEKGPKLFALDLFWWRLRKLKRIQCKQIYHVKACISSRLSNRAYHQYEVLHIIKPEVDKEIHGFAVMIYKRKRLMICQTTAFTPPFRQFAYFERKHALFGGLRLFPTRRRLAGTPTSFRFG